jgi:hypothetical protein
MNSNWPSSDINSTSSLTKKNRTEAPSDLWGESTKYAILNVLRRYENKLRPRHSNRSARLLPIDSCATAVRMRRATAAHILTSTNYFECFEVISSICTLQDDWLRCRMIAESGMRDVCRNSSARWIWHVVAAAQRYGTRTVITEAYLCLVLGGGMLRVMWITDQLKL